MIDKIVLLSQMIDNDVRSWAAEAFAGAFAVVQSSWQMPLLRHSRADINVHIFGLQDINVPRSTGCALRDMAPRDGLGLATARVAQGPGRFPGLLRFRGV